MKNVSFASQVKFLSEKCFTGISASNLYSVGIPTHKKAGVYQFERDGVLYAIAIWGGKRTYVAKWVKGPTETGVWESLLGGCSFPSRKGGKFLFAKRCNTQSNPVRVRS